MSRINFNHVLQFEDELNEQLTIFVNEAQEKADPLELSKIAVFVDIDKQLAIIADTMSNIERRLESDQDNTLH